MNRPRIRPPEPLAKHNLVFVVLDSCRFDAFARASLRYIPKLGEVQRRWSYASWTAPSHFNLLMGLLPHPSPPHVYASDHYKYDFRLYDERLGTEGVAFERLLPSLYLPTFLRRDLGYYTHAKVSIPVLNPATPLNVDFDTFELMDQHNDFGAMIDALHFSDQRPSFQVLNVGETHFPYATVEEPRESWPKVHGAGGVFEPLDGHVGGALVREGATDVRFRQSALDALRDKQVRALESVDALFEKFFDVVPKGTWVVVTADHGELFGEDGYFGHGPIQHPKVLEVPFIEGRI